MSLITLAGLADYEEVVKKSRFIARANRVESPEQAQTFVDSVRDATATHNCWAYRIGGAYRFSDDGEPGGTAGRPILGAIDAQGVDHAAVVVTRFFGGIKLGAGGLARAYGGCAASCLRLAERIEVIPKVKGQLTTSFDSLGVVYHLFDQFGVVRSTERYDGSGVTWDLQLDRHRAREFERHVRDATRGAANLVWSESDTE